MLWNRWCLPEELHVDILNGVVTAHSCGDQPGGFAYRVDARIGAEIGSRAGNADLVLASSANRDEPSIGTASEGYESAIRLHLPDGRIQCLARRTHAVQTQKSKWLSRANRVSVLCLKPSECAESGR